MILNIDIDAAYLVTPKARSRVAGYYHLSSISNVTEYPRLNEDIHVEYKTLRHVVSSAAKSEIGGIFHNTQVAIPIRIPLQVLKYPQPPTPIKNG